jgi:hypothetical protein
LDRFFRKSRLSAPSPERRANSHSVLKFFEFLIVMVSTQLTARRERYSPFPRLSITKVGILIGIQVSVLSSSVVLKPIRVLVSAGMLSELLAALISLWVLLSAGERNVSPHQSFAAVASTVLVSIGIMTLVAAIVLETIYVSGALASGQGGVC